MQDKGNVEDLKTIALEANFLQANMTMKMLAINGLNKKCKDTVDYDSSIALNEVQRGKWECDLNGEFPPMQHGWLTSATD